MNSTIIAFNITKPVGVRGEVKAKSFIDIKFIPQYEPYFYESGKKIVITKVTPINQNFVKLKTSDINTLEEAESLRGKNILCSRDKFCDLKEDEFYISDLLEKAAFYKDTQIGTIKSVEDFGGGAIINLQTNDSKAYYIPFNKDCFPQNDKNHLELSDFGYEYYVKPYTMTK